MDIDQKQLLKEARKDIDKIFKKHRPYPPLGYSHGPKFDYYFRRRDLPYWDLRKMFFDRHISIRPSMHRPRPLMGPFHGPNGDYYIRKRDVTYWDLKKKYPGPPISISKVKHRHIFSRGYHFSLESGMFWSFFALPIFIGGIIGLTAYLLYRLIRAGITSLFYRR